MCFKSTYVTVNCLSKPGLSVLLKGPIAQGVLWITGVVGSSTFHSHFKLCIAGWLHKNYGAQMSAL